MNKRPYKTLLSSLLLLSGWWSACSSSDEAAQAELNASTAEADVDDAELSSDSEGAGENSAPINAEAAEETADAGAEAEAANSGEDFLQEDTEAAPEAAENSALNQVVNATADPAFAAESTAIDPTALADNASESVNASGNASAPEAMAAAAAEAEAAVASDVAAVGVGSEMIPPSFNGENPGPNNIAATGAPPAAVSPPAPPAAAEPKAEDLDSSLALLSWVGYRINEKDRQLKVEVLTQGRPEFEIYEETNRAQQLELVIRLYQTKLRRKIRRDINSSEFRSPVAFIRMREFQERGVVDIILTHRDPLLPQFLAKNGQMLLVYPIPDRYFDQNKPAARVISEKAQSLSKTTDLPLGRVAAVEANKPKQIGFPRPDLFQNETQLTQPVRDFMRQQSLQDIDKEGLPASFERRPEVQFKAKPVSWRTEHFSLMAVAQDDGGDEESLIDDPAEGEAAAAEAIDEAETEGSSVENAVSAEAKQISDEEAAADAADAEPIPVEEVTAGANSVQAAENSSAEANAAQNAAASSANMANNAAANPAGNAASPPAAAAANTMANEMVPALSPAAEPQSSIPDVVGQNNAGEAAPQYNGKAIFMEFYEAPLSVVLKTFSEETGNNFVYPTLIGQMPVTINFKGVPWDEALKAILETYSLGMVRIGQNVVRVDQIGNLTQYMQALEQARQFETRRLPTKVLVFRLNNAVAKDVAARISALLGADIQLDTRIKVSDDERTNSLVMEAPVHVLAKAKNIIERLDLETPQVEIASRIVEVQKTQNSFFGVSWLNNFNFDPGRALGFGSLNFPNSLGSNFAVDPGVSGQPTAGVGRFRFGSLNKFVDLDLLLKMEEKKGTTNVLQSNRVLVLDGQKAMILAGSSQFFRPAAGGNVINPGAGGGAPPSASSGLSEVQFNLSMEVTPQVTALGSVIMNLNIKSDTPGDSTGEVLANKSTRELETQMVRSNGDTGVIGGIYDTNRQTTVSGVPFLSDIPILGALFRSTSTIEKQTELLIMVTPTIISGMSKEAEAEEESAARTLQPEAPQALVPAKTKIDSSIF